MVSFSAALCICNDWSCSSHDVAASVSVSFNDAYMLLDYSLPKVLPSALKFHDNLLGVIRNVYKMNN